MREADRERVEDLDFERCRPSSSAGISSVGVSTLGISTLGVSVPGVSSGASSTGGSSLAGSSSGISSFTVPSYYHQDLSGVGWEVNLPCRLILATLEIQAPQHPQRRYWHQVRLVQEKDWGLGLGNEVWLENRD